MASPTRYVPEENLFAAEAPATPQAAPVATDVPKVSTITIPEPDRDAYGPIFPGKTPQEWATLLADLDDRTVLLLLREHERAVFHMETRYAIACLGMAMVQQTAEGRGLIGVCHTREEVRQNLLTSVLDDLVNHHAATVKAKQMQELEELLSATPQNTVSGAENGVLPPGLGTVKPLPRE